MFCFIGGSYYFKNAVSIKMGIISSKKTVAVLYAYKRCIVVTGIVWYKLIYKMNTKFWKPVKQILNKQLIRFWKDHTSAVCSKIVFCKSWIAFTFKAANGVLTTSIKTKTREHGALIYIWQCKTSDLLWVWTSCISLHFYEPSYAQMNVKDITLNLLNILTLFLKSNSKKIIQVEPEESLLSSRCIE